jgi:hypothetical protein
MRWNGSSWSVVPTPNVSQHGNFLSAVLALDETDAWAFGMAGATDDNQTLIMRWNGSSWSVVPSPVLGTGRHAILGAAAAGPNDIWAVGQFYGSAMTLHWDGSSWSNVPAPDLRYMGAATMDVAVRGPGEVWAVGSYPHATLGQQALAMRWDGAAWSPVTVPNPQVNSGLAGLALAPNGDMWGVGTAGAGPQSRTLVERYSEPCGR